MTEEIRLPDLGEFKDVEIIEIHVSAGDQIASEAPLLTIESDKASMDVPSPQAGTVASVQVAVGDKINQGDLLAVLEASSGDKASSSAAAPAAAASAEPAAAQAAQQPEQSPVATDADASASAETTVEVPDIGEFEDIEIIEVKAAAGDTVAAEDTLITLESDKASMDVPAPQAGTVVKMLVKTGDKVSKGSPIAVLKTNQAAASPAAASPSKQPAAAQPQPASSAASDESPAAPTSGALPMPGHKEREGKPHASPAVRKLAREFGADLTEVAGTGPKERILKSDLQQYIRKRLAGGPSSGSMGNFGYDLPEPAKIDFSEFGPVQTSKLSRIMQLSGPALHRNWLTIPHITQFDNADITDLERFRKEHIADAKKRGFGLSPLAFIVKACTVALRKYPQFNSSLAPDGKSIILKDYWHIGIAVETPAGLVVPVIRDADSKSVMQIAEEMAAIASSAREGKLKPSEMRGGTFTISSLGGIGGTFFTPIINHPEVAILGCGRASIQPVYEGSDFSPRLMQPLALSYDHRVIDGANGARFITYLSSLLADIRNVLL